MSRMAGGSTWKPPNGDGTASQDRAKRYMKADGSGGQGSGAAEEATKQNMALSRSRRGSLPGREQAAGPAAAADAAVAEDEDEVELDEDFASGWNYFERHEPLPAGSLRKVGHGGPLPGMSHPPQNPKVQEELMLYLQKHGAQAKVERRPVRQPRGRRTSTIGGEEEVGSPAGASCSRSDRALGRGSSSSSKRASWTLPWAPALDMSGSKGAAPGRVLEVAPKGQQSPAELWAELKELHSTVRSAPPPVSFLELGHWHRKLVNKSINHGIDLSQKTTEDVSDLAMYHNSLSRSAVPSWKEPAKSLGCSASTPTLGLRRPRALNLEESGGFGASWSPSRTGSSFDRHDGGKQPFNMSLDSVRQHSAEKLRAKAEAALRAGPSRLQFLSEVSRVSTATGEAPHRSRIDWLYGPPPPE